VGFRPWGGLEGYFWVVLKYLVVDGLNARKKKKKKIKKQKKKKKKKKKKM
jgi:hypothetical protein